MKGLELEAQSYYSEDVKMRRNNLVDMMIIDGCFILELFRDMEKSESKHVPLGESGEPALDPPEGRDKPVSAHGHGFLKRWMLPVLRNDLIMLENQLPLPGATSSCSSIHQLALNFFSPLMLGADRSPQKSDSNNTPNDAKHLLDLFRSSILPGAMKRGREPYLFRSLVELNEAGIKVRSRATESSSLDIKFELGVLEIPSFSINDYQCTLYRNMVAFEQCYKACQPDVIRYLLFLDGLINSAKDIELLHYTGMLQHSVGSNKRVARKVNKLCREVSPDTDDSYLSDFVKSIENYCHEPWHRYRASLVHNYFTNLWVTVSTAAAAILVYLAVLQTCCDLAETHDSLHKSGFWKLVGKTFVIPFSHSLTVTGLVTHPSDEFLEFILLYC